MLMQINITPDIPAIEILKTTPLQPPVVRAGFRRRGATTARLVALALAGMTAACAQNRVPVEPPARAPVAAPATPVPADTAAPEASAPAPGQVPAFTESNFGMAFNYIDTNKDGQLSREEGARFRGIARNFDAADVNHDGVISRQEFDNAMRRSLSK